MSPGEVQAPPRVHGDVLSAISDGMVALLKEFYGHGPSRTKSYYSDDLVVCVLRGGFSRVEQTLLEGGRGEAVIEQRMEFQSGHDVRGLHSRAHRPRRPRRDPGDRAAGAGLIRTDRRQRAAIARSPVARRRCAE
ncbi:MAG: Na-translocating system protein MpsC family protein [Solirubrobacteraceae bacterium]